MFAYYLRLALRSLGRSPGVAALTVLAMGLGIAVCVMMLTMYHAMAGNPIAWKNDRLYAVTIDSWAAERPSNRERPHLPPQQLTYRDALQLLESPIPQRKVITYPVTVTVGGTANQGQPLRVRTRVTTADFFPMFDIPFHYGSGWSAGADTAPEPVIVLSHELNEELFGGENSVGRTVPSEDLDFRVIGVLERWEPQPKFYDLTTGPFNPSEQAYVPWGWGRALQLRSSGVNRCWKFEPVATWDDVAASQCVWIMMWVELPDEQARERMQAHLDAYWAGQRRNGRFERPQNNRLTRVDQWLADYEVVQDDNRLLVGLAFAFFGVCIINAVGLLLTKFLNGAAAVGIRRALGADRAQVFAQHFVEVGVLGAAGSVLGLLLGAAFLWGVRTLYPPDEDWSGARYQALAQFDVVSIVWAVVLAVAAIVIAGVYPAWRVCHVSPASYLKSQ